MPWIAGASGSASIPMIVPAGSLLALGVAALAVMLVTGSRRTRDAAPLSTR